MSLNISKYAGRIIYNKVIPERAGSYVEYPDALNPALKTYLQKNGFTSLYSHQADMFEKVMAGKNVVITTSTSSGKTLSFLLPILQTILQNPSTRAIFIYPTKALASDQFRNLEPFLEYFGKSKIQAGIYDGDTPVHERSSLRNNANIILTNPDMLNSAFLPHHSQYGFDFIFSNLRYIVIDELHSYRGIFGSHLANVMRRLLRISKFYKTNPQFMCSSATIANPVELAVNICNKPFEIIDNDGSPAAEKHFYFWQPPLVKNKSSNTSFVIPVLNEVTDVIPDLVQNKTSFLAFCKSRKSVEVALLETRNKLQYDGIPGVNKMKLISGYRGGYKPLERKEIESKMVSGEILGLITTNALELGIDIGKIDMVMMVGYPGTRSSFWQQSGRAGRKKNKATILLFLDHLVSDQYIAQHPEWLFTSGIENAIIDKNNLFIQIAHIRSAAAELPLSLDDAIIFPDLGEIVPVLHNAKELRREGGKFVWSGKSFPAGDYSLRNLDRERYKLVNLADNSVITEMDEQSTFRELYPGAIYLHDGSQFQVDKLDLQGHLAEARPIDVNYYTVPSINDGLQVIKVHNSGEVGLTKKKFGDIFVITTVQGYKKIQYSNYENLGYENLETALTRSFETEGVWFVLPKNVDDVFAKLSNPLYGKIRENYWLSYYGGMGHSLLNAAMMVTMSTRIDISSNILKILQDDEPVNAIAIYDIYVGGLGHAEKIFTYGLETIHRAVEFVQSCRCEEGCPLCVGDYNLDKQVILWGLKNLLQESEPPESVKDILSSPRIFIEKSFLFERLKDEWPQFIDHIKKNGENFADFLSIVDSVEIQDSILLIEISNDFYKQWLQEGNNLLQVKNIIRSHVDVPVNFDVHIELKGQNNAGKNDQDLIIAKRLRDLNREKLQ